MSRLGTGGRSRKRDGQRGQVVVLTALLLPVMAGFASLVIDGGYVYSRHQAAQAAADAGAQAGALALARGYSPSSAIADAQAYVTRNGFTGANSTVDVNLPPKSPPASHAYSSNYVQVIVTAKSPPFLSGILGIVGLSATAQAVAGGTGSNGLPCALCIMAPSASGAFHMNGSGNVSVSGKIVVDSNSPTAATFNGAATVNTTEFDVAGSSSLKGAVRLNPIPTAGLSPIPDPLASYPLVSSAGLPNYGSLSSGGGLLNPGIYSSIDLTGSGSLTLNPGLYILTGAFSVHGSWNITGNGVTLYFACSSYPTPCSPGEIGGGITLHGSGSIHLSAPISGDNQGMLFFYDRNNAAPFSIYGSSDLYLSGTMYARSSALDLHGSPGGLDSMVIVDTLSISGAGTIGVSASPMTNVPLAASSLVE